MSKQLWRERERDTERERERERENGVDGVCLPLRMSTDSSGNCRKAADRVVAVIIFTFSLPRPPGEKFFPLNKWVVNFTLTELIQYELYMKWPDIRYNQL